jgi:hypothetical protein
MPTYIIIWQVGPISVEGRHVEALLAKRKKLRDYI